jgi:predicted TPR repeat methyltransferase
MGKQAGAGAEAAGHAPPGHDVLVEAVARHRAGDLALAERLYLQVLDAAPGHPDALHFSGVLAHQRGRSDEAVELIGKALASAPQHAGAHNNLGNVHKECGRLAEAEACYRRALDCSPGHPDALTNLAVVLEAQGQLVDAFKVYGILLTLAPEHAVGYYLFGIFLRNNARCEAHVEQAVACLREAWRLDPANTRTLEQLGVTLYMTGRGEEAAKVHRDWLARDPENPIPKHMLAACGGAPPPARAGDDYVRQVFDGFAASFDEQLLSNLDYRAPQLVATALARVFADEPCLDILDAGCGTGLCAPLLRSRARRLTGVDLSGGMVDKARERGGYDELVVGELAQYLREHPGAFDVVVSADTLVYFGDLHEVGTAAARALRPGGAFVFTVEALVDDPGGVELGPSGRYRHGEAHVRRALESAGLADPSITEGVLRREFGNEVCGWIVVARPEPIAADDS